MTRRPISKALVVGFAGIASVGCGSAQISPADPLDGTSWQLVALEKTDPLPGITITVAFDDGRAHGFSGCNMFGASYQVEGQAIEIPDIEWTLRACIEPEGVMDQERKFIALLGRSDRYQLAAGELRMSGPGGKLLTFVPED